MGFTIHSTDDGRACPWEYLPAGAITPKIGLLLVQSSGNLAVAGATAKPAYVCMTQASAALTAGTIIPVIKVQPDIVFETTFSETATSRKTGEAVTTASGLQATATTSSGVFTITEIVDGAAGGAVRGRFL